jgi:hypothetical protein
MAWIWSDAANSSINELSRTFFVLFAKWIFLLPYVVCFHLWTIKFELPPTVTRSRATALDRCHYMKFDEVLNETSYVSTDTSLCHCYFKEWTINSKSQLATAGSRQQRNEQHRYEPGFKWITSGSLLQHSLYETFGASLGLQILT